MRALVALWTLAFASPAHAEDWWLVPLAAEESAGPVLETYGARLKSGVEAIEQRAIMAEATRTRFEETVSSPAAELDQDDIDEWVHRSREAVRSLARAEYEQAREHLLEAQRLSTNAAEELNREVARAREVIDTCLFMVRAFLETRQRDEAERQARECRRLVPTVEPTRVRHTPEVRELLDRIDEQIAAEPSARLRVASQPAGCVVRVNGIQFGETPYLVDDLRPGDYRLQVECDPEQRGRVRRIRLGQGETEVGVDAQFDAAVQSRPTVSIAPGPDAQLHAAKLAALVNAKILLFSEESQRLHLLLIGAEGLVAESRVPAGADVTGALRAMKGGHSMDYTVTPPAEIRSDADIAATPAPEPEAPARAIRPLSTPRIAVGLSAGALSLGAFVGALFAHVRHRQWGEIYVDAMPTDVDFIDRQQKWNGLDTPVAAMSLVGFGLGTLAVGVATPEADGVPWWSWLLGAAGLGSVVAGIVSGATATACGSISENQQACVDRSVSTDRAWIFSTFGGVLLAFPLAHLIGRDPSGDELSASISIGAQGIQLRGAF